MEWKHEYSIDIPELDEQHKRLLDCVTRLVTNERDPRRDLAVYFILGELEDYARVHFAIEEALMRVFDFPGRQAHAREHGLFAAFIESMQKSALRRDVRYELVTRLDDWVASHFLVADRECAEFLRTNRVVLLPR